MDQGSALSELRKTLQEVKGKGLSHVSIDRLDSYIAELSQEVAKAGAHSNATAKYQHDMEVWKISQARLSAFQQEMMKAVLEAGLSAIKFAVAINGGAAVALLAFVGNLIAKDAAVLQTPSTQRIAAALLAFVTGVALAGLCSGFRYLCQESYTQLDDAIHSSKEKAAKRWRVAGVTFHIGAALLGVASFAAFVWGGTSAYWAISTYGLS